MFSVLQAAREQPTAVALVVGDSEVTYAALARRVSGVVNALQAERIETPVAFEAKPELDSIVRLLAAIETGLPVVPLHPKQTSQWHDEIVRRTGAVRVDDLDPAAGSTLTQRPGRVLAIIPTSGSTGPSKLAVLSRAAFEAAVIASEARLGWQPEDRWLLALTFAHVGGLSVLLRCLAARRTVVLARAEDDPFELMSRDHVTLCSCVPTQLSRLGDVPGSMRAVLLGGAAAPMNLVRSLRERGWPLRLTWGMTETGSQIATSDIEDVTCGPPLPGYEVRSIDGQLHVRTPSLLDGWLENGTVRDPRVGGWLRTGDLGHLDDKGRVVVLGRADQVIVTGGENVSPASVEARLLELDGVIAAVVFGVPDERWGQLVCAAIVAGAPESLVLDQLFRSSLAPFERPRRVAFLPSLPLLPSGKVDRVAVKRLAGSLLRTI